MTLILQLFLLLLTAGGALWLGAGERWLLWIAAAGFITLGFYHLKIFFFPQISWRTFPAALKLYLKRRLGRQLAMGCFLLLSLSCFFLAHYLTSHWTWGIELAAEKGWGMSAGLRQFLREQKHHFNQSPLSLLYIGPKQQWQEMNEVHRRLEAYLGSFAAQYLDPDYSPQVLAQLQVKQVPAIRLGHAGKEVWLTNFDQQSWFDAFAQLAGMNRARYCWISDLGAPSLEDSTSLGLSSFKQTLQQRGIALSARTIGELTVQGGFQSTSCLGLVFWGVTQDLTPLQAKILKQWPGQWVVALDPFLGPQTLLELRGLIRGLFGVEWAQGLAIDQRAGQLKLDPFFILGEASGVQTLWPLSGHLQVQGKATYVELIKTIDSPQVWLERSEREVNQTQALSFNPQQDRPGPLLLALQVDNRALLLANTKAPTNSFQRYPEAAQVLAGFWQQLALKTSVKLAPLADPAEPPLVTRPWLTELKAYWLLALSVGLMPLLLLFLAFKLLFTRKPFRASVASMGASIGASTTVDQVKSRI